MKVIKVERIENLSMNYDIEVVDNHNFMANGILVHNCYGQDITSKAKYIKGLPQTIPYGVWDNFTGSIRGELVIMREDFEGIKDNFSNRRNAVAGIINRKNGDKKFNPDELRRISFVPYSILGNQYAKEEQFGFLEDVGFNVAWNVLIAKEGIDDTIVDWLFKTAQDELPYDTDGLVLSDSEYRNEDAYRPKAQVAFKINQSSAVTKIIGFDWGTPSASGRMTPVALLEPVEIAGVIVKRVTCNNITWMEKLGVEIGKTVRVLRSGEVIPKIVEVLD